MHGSILTLLVVTLAGPRSVPLAAIQPPLPERAHVAPRVAGRPPTPCFPKAASLAAVDIHKKLQRYADSIYTDADVPLPPGKFGSCTITRNILRDEDGKVVAELGCGVRVLSRGIHDQLGIGIGARGLVVIDRMPASEMVLTCLANGPDQVRCRYNRAPDSDVDQNDYAVAGSLGEDILTGKAARSFFAPRRVVELLDNVWCH